MDSTEYRINRRADSRREDNMVLYPSFGEKGMNGFVLFRFCDCVIGGRASSLVQGLIVDIRSL